MKKIIGILLLICVVLVGCFDPDDSTNQNGKLPGRFSATVLSDSMGGNARGISLGTFTITNSKSIFFILRNIGDFPITGIALTPGKLINNATFEPITDNAVTASPSAITVLETTGNTSVESVIEVNINHGDVIGLIAQQYIQKADFAGTTIRITGKTTNEEGAVLDVSLDLDISTLIKVASFEVHYSLDNGATFKKAEFGTQWNNDQVKLFLIPENGFKNVYIVNTGNVPLKYRNIPAPIEIWLNGVDLNVGESKIIDYPTYYTSVSLYVDTLGIVFDNNGLDLSFDVGTSTIRTEFAVKRDVGVW